MSDSIQESEAASKVIRAAFSAALSEREQIDIARKNAVRSVDFPEKQFLSFLDFKPMGYPMGDELDAIAAMYSGNTVFSEITNDNPKINIHEIALDDAKARLYDKLLNISPDIEPFVSLEKDYPILNRVYEKFLRYSEFAGKFSSNSEELEEAEGFLFPKNEEGTPEESDAYKLYDDYKTKCSELELKIAEASNSGSISDVDRLKRSLKQAQAEWNTLGRKGKVEEAIDVINRYNTEAGYEDERNAFIDLLESSLKDRLGSSNNYATVTISPLTPLLDPKEDAQWQRFSLTVTDIKRYLTPDICQLFSINEEELSYVLRNFKSASIQYIRVVLTREWLSKDFLTARYWKNKSSLSDGNGFGELPTFISSAFFIKSAKFEMHQGINVYEVRHNNYRNENIKDFFTYNVIEIPLMKAVIQEDMLKISDVEKKLITEKDISNLNTSDILQSQEKLRHKEAEKIELPSKMLQADFKPAIRDHRRIDQLGEFEKNLQLNDRIINHRNNAMTENVIGSPDVNSSKQIKALNILGRIKHNKNLDEKDLKVELIFLDKNNDASRTKDIQLSIQSDKIVFRINVSNPQGINFFGFPTKVPFFQSIIIKLTDKDGNDLIQKKIEFIDKSKDIILDWDVSLSSVVIELSSPVTSTLFAYSLQLMPKSPNPDESIFNS